MIKRNGMILTPDVGEGHHEFEVTDPYKESRMVMADGTPCPTGGTWYEKLTYGKDYFQEYVITIRVIK